MSVNFSSQATNRVTQDQLLQMIFSENSGLDHSQRNLGKIKAVVDNTIPIAPSFAYTECPELEGLSPEAKIEHLEGVVREGKIEQRHINYLEHVLFSERIVRTCWLARIALVEAEMQQRRIISLTGANTGSDLERIQRALGAPDQRRVAPFLSDKEVRDEGTQKNLQSYAVASFPVSCRTERLQAASIALLAEGIPLTYVVIRSSDGKQEHEFLVSGSPEEIKRAFQSAASYPNTKVGQYMASLPPDSVIIDPHTCASPFLARDFASSELKRFFDRPCFNGFTCHFVAWPVKPVCQHIQSLQQTVPVCPSCSEGQDPAILEFQERVKHAQHVQRIASIVLSAMSVNQSFLEEEIKNEFFFSDMSDAYRQRILAALVAKGMPAATAALLLETLTYNDKITSLFSSSNSPQQAAASLAKSTLIYGALVVSTIFDGSRMPEGLRDEVLSVLQFNQRALEIELGSGANVSTENVLTALASSRQVVANGLISIGIQVEVIAPVMNTLFSGQQVVASLMHSGDVTIETVEAATRAAKELMVAAAFPVGAPIEHGERLLSALCRPREAVAKELIFAKGISANRVVGPLLSSSNTIDFLRRMMGCGIEPTPLYKNCVKMLNDLTSLATASSSATPQ